LAPHGFDPIDRRIEVPSNAAARLAAVNGSGIAILPIDQVASDLAIGHLVRLDLRDALLEQPVRVVWKGTQPATEAARRLLSSLAGP
jgi:DNA-binding transcriptional LysR family regulator